VTHDVEEAILLADRILVLKSGRISLDTGVALDRPRVMGGPGFDQLRLRLLAELGVLDGSEITTGRDPEAQLHHDVDTHAN
jgi:sulfonate transport system ATP-binding protein